MYSADWSICVQMILIKSVHNLFARKPIQNYFALEIASCRQESYAFPILILSQVLFFREFYYSTFLPRTRRFIFCQIMQKATFSHGLSDTVSTLFQGIPGEKRDISNTIIDCSQVALSLYQLHLAFPLFES